MSITKTQREISKVCNEIKTLLLQKNQAYGNSFQFPINVFSKATAEEQVLVRIDDKLNRLKKGTGTHLVQEDTVLDLIGYLILLRVLNNFNKKG
jgi:hypothetical protein